MNEPTNSDVAAAIQALDFSAENAEVESLVKSIKDAEAAIARAEARCTEIARTLIEARGPDGTAVADSLLRHSDASEAARVGPTAEELTAEKTSLRAGIKELHERVRGAHQRIADIQRKALSAAGLAVEPIVAEKLTELRTLADHVMSAFAALDAISAATGCHSIARDQAREAVNSLTAPKGPADWRRYATVAEEIVELLAPLGTKGPALRVSLIQQARL